MPCLCCPPSAIDAAAAAHDRAAGCWGPPAKPGREGRASDGASEYSEAATDEGLMPPPPPLSPPNDEPGPRAEDGAAATASDAG